MSGYAHCGCRDCFELIVATVPGKDLCRKCKKAGCERGDHECQRDDAYGADSYERGNDE